MYSQLSMDFDSKLVYQSKVIPFSIQTNCFNIRLSSVPALLRLDEMCHMLFRVVLPIKLLEFWRLVAMGHAEHINPLVARLGIKMSLTHTSPKLCLDCICNQVLDLSDGH